MSKARVLLFYLALGGGLVLADTSYEGNFNSADCGPIKGWAWDTTGAIFSVDYYDGATYLANTQANVHTGSDSYKNGAYQRVLTANPCDSKGYSDP